MEPRCPQGPVEVLKDGQYDAGRDGFIDLMELKLMMEKLGAPQTHLGLKNMIKEVDEDFDSKLSFREASLCTHRYDAGRDGFIDLMELKLMMEKLGAPQTHLGLKNMIKEVDEDFDSKLSFREFLLIFRKAAAGELQEDSGLHVLARLSEIDVSTEGVKGAKSFFEAKVQAMNVSSRFEEEIKAEQEERKKQAEEMKQRKAAFKELQSTFK
ncbi:EFHD2 [Cervus elaphus hippelaphus]|uniref:EFHD2 n=2 Tax=Pecora TaxID=35500 RepID=A0A212CQK4_CEREH|nr:EFHD2 [Cervus elaphus hippelaphus]